MRESQSRQPAPLGGAMAERGRPAHYLDPEVVARYGERYAGLLGGWKHRRKVSILRRWLSSSHRLLEVACGPGRFEAVLAEHSALACDRSVLMLQHYRQLHPSRALVAVDAGALPFPDGSFDAVFAIRFVSHLRGEYRARVLAELARVSRDLVVIDGRHRYNFRYISRHLRWKLGMSHADKLRHGYRAFADECAAAGLELISRRSVAWGLSARCLLLARKPSGHRSPPQPL